MQNIKNTPNKAFVILNKLFRYVILQEREQIMYFIYELYGDYIGQTILTKLFIWSFIKRVTDLSLTTQAEDNFSHVALSPLWKKNPYTCSVWYIKFLNMIPTSALMYLLHSKRQYKMQVITEWTASKSWATTVSNFITPQIWSLVLTRLSTPEIFFNGP